MTSELDKYKQSLEKERKKYKEELEKIDSEIDEARCMSILSPSQVQWAEEKDRLTDEKKIKVKEAEEAKENIVSEIASLENELKLTKSSLDSAMNTKVVSASEEKWKQNKDIFDAEKELDLKRALKKSDKKEIENIKSREFSVKEDKALWKQEIKKAETIKRQRINITQDNIKKISENIVELRKQLKTANTELRKVQKISVKPELERDVELWKAEKENLKEEKKKLIEKIKQKRSRLVADFSKTKKYYNSKIRELGGKVKSNSSKSDYQSRYYKMNKAKISARKKAMYDENKEYKETILERAKLRYEIEKSDPIDRQSFTTVDGFTVYSIGVVSEQVGIPVYQIRIFHTEGVIPEPTFFDNRGWRFYSEYQIKLLKKSFGEYVEQTNRSEYKQIKSDIKSIESEIKQIDKKIAEIKSEKIVLDGEEAYKKTLSIFKRKIRSERGKAKYKYRKALGENNAEKINAAKKLQEEIEIKAANPPEVPESVKKKREIIEKENREKIDILKKERADLVKQLQKNKSQIDLEVTGNTGISFAKIARFLAERWEK